MINFGACFACAVVRAKVDYQSAFQEAPHRLTAILMDLFIFVTVLLIISACFLADALRRLKKSFSASNKMVVN